MTGRSGDPVSLRGLNRALLARQLLLDRRAGPAIDVVEHLVGLQAQAPNAPYVALWSRVADFAAAELTDLVRTRAVVRATALRCTVHALSRRDCLGLRPLLLPLLERSFAGSPFGAALRGADLAAIVSAGQALVTERPSTRAELGAALAERFPGLDATSLAYAVTYLVPTVQVPPRGVWGETGPPRFSAVAAELGRPHSPGHVVDDVVLRGLAAFGPASVADLRTWSGLTGLGEVVERLAPRLRAFRGPDGPVLWDLPDAPRPDGDVPAPARFLAEYDNVLLSHADRARILVDGRRAPLPPGNGGVTGTVLVDGRYRADWRTVRDRARGAVTLTVRPFSRLTRAEHTEVCAEAARLVEFTAGDATSRDVQIRPADG